MPKFFLYLGSLIGILFIFFGVLSFFVSQNNNSQLQINNVQEIKNQEEKKEEEKSEEKENIFFKILYLIMIILSLMISITLIMCGYYALQEYEKSVLNIKEYNNLALIFGSIFIIFGIITLLPLFLIPFLTKGKTVSIVVFIIQIIFSLLIVLYCIIINVLNVFHINFTNFFLHQVEIKNDK